MEVDPRSITHIWKMDKKVKSPGCSSQKTKYSVEKNGTNVIAKDRANKINGTNLISKDGANEKKVLADLNAGVLTLGNGLQSVVDIRVKKVKRIDHWRSLISIYS